MTGALCDSTSACWGKCCRENRQLATHYVNCLDLAGGFPVRGSTGGPQNDARASARALVHGSCCFQVGWFSSTLNWAWKGSARSRLGRPVDRPAPSEPAGLVISYRSKSSERVWSLFPASWISELTPERFQRCLRTSCDMMSHSCW